MFKLQLFVVNLKLCIKYNFIDHIVNNIQLTQNLTCILKAQKCVENTRAVQTPKLKLRLD